MVRRAAFYFRGRGWISVHLLLGLLTLLMSGEVRFLKLSLGNHYITESRLVWGECQKNVLLLFTQIKWHVLLSVSEITTVINGHRFACSFWIAKFSKQDSLILLKNSIGMIGYVEMQKEIIKKKITEGTWYVLQGALKTAEWASFFLTSCSSVGPFSRGQTWRNNLDLLPAPNRAASAKE